MNKQRAFRIAAKTIVAEERKTQKGLFDDPITHYKKKWPDGFRNEKEAEKFLKWKGSPLFNEWVSMLEKIDKETVITGTYNAVANAFKEGMDVDNMDMNTMVAMADLDTIIKALENQLDAVDRIDKSIKKLFKDDSENVLNGFTNMIVSGQVSITGGGGGNYFIPSENLIKNIRKVKKELEKVDKAVDDISDVLNEFATML